MLDIERFELSTSPESDLRTKNANMAHEAVLSYIDDNGKYVVIDRVEILSGESHVAVTWLMFKIAARLLEYEGVK